MTKTFGFEKFDDNPSGLTCYYCKGEYKSTDCKCGHGMDIEKHKKIMNAMENWQPEYTIWDTAKGLILLNLQAFILKDEKKLTTYWFKASEEERKEARQLWRDGYRSKVRLTTGTQRDNVEQKTIINVPPESTPA